MPKLYVDEIIIKQTDRNKELDEALTYMKSIEILGKPYIVTGLTFSPNSVYKCVYMLKELTIHKENKNNTG